MDLHSFLILAQDGGQPGPFGGLGGILIPIGLMFLIFYMLVFRPESKKRKERIAKIESAKKGDTVITSGGIFGKVWKVDGQEMVIQIDRDKDIKVRIIKNAILEVLDKEASEAKKPSEDTVRELEQRAR